MRNPLNSHEFAFLGKFDATRESEPAESRARSGLVEMGLRTISRSGTSTTARQLRPIGRLAFFRNYVTFKTLMTHKLRATRQLASIQEAEERGFPVAADHQLIYVVSSLCGGTGAGMFLDRGPTVSARRSARNANVVGIFLMPSTFESEIRSDLQRRRIQANAYAALKELNHFHENQDFKGFIRARRCRCDHEVSGVGSDLPRRTDQCRRSDSVQQEQAEQMIADLIHLMSMSHLNQRILGLDVNVTEERACPRWPTATSAICPTAPSAHRRSSCLRRRCGVTSLLRGIVLGDRGPVGWRGRRRGRGRKPFVDDVPGATRCAEGGVHAVSGDRRDLKALEGDVAQIDGRWLGFAAIVSDEMRSLLPTYGLQGLRYILHRLALGDAQCRTGSR